MVDTHSAIKAGVDFQGKFIPKLGLNILNSSPDSRLGDFASLGIGYRVLGIGYWVSGIGY
jgi:hypothetical protein